MLNQQACLLYQCEEFPIMTLSGFSEPDQYPRSAWLVSKMGRLTAGVQYEPQCEFPASSDLGDL